MSAEKKSISSEKYYFLQRKNEALQLEVSHLTEQNAKLSDQLEVTLFLSHKSLMKPLAYEKDQPEAQTEIKYPSFPGRYIILYISFISYFIEPKTPEIKRAPFRRALTTLLDNPLAEKLAEKKYDQTELPAIMERECIQMIIRTLLKWHE